MHGFVSQYFFLQRHFPAQGVYHRLFMAQRCGKMKIAVGAGLPAKRYVQINSGHGR
jgi:hypothetical protein